MSTKLGFLSLRLEGMFQSWGFDSQYNRRNTRMMPTRSAIAGMCCAALGINRGSQEETDFLSSQFSTLKMISIAIPRKIKTKALDKVKSLEPIRINDYHTVQNTMKADKKLKDCHITNRYYLADASFGVVLQGDYMLLEKLYDAFKNPIWGLWLGRKCCIPTAPIMAGLFNDEKSALQVLINETPLEYFTVEKEVDNFLDGRDSISDYPLSFNKSNRVFAPRRIITTPGKM